MTIEEIAAYGRALHSVLIKTVQERPLTEEDACIIAAAALSQLLSETHEVARYTAAADQERLADSAIKQLSEWEMSNPGPKLDIKSKKRTENG